MSTRHAAPARWLAAGLILLLGGCGPTRTAGTGGLPPAELAVLTVPQLPAESPLRILKIQFDGAGEAYEVGGGRDFYLLPRNHAATFTLEAVIPKKVDWLKWVVPKEDRIIHGPNDVPLGPMSAGKAYELTPPTEGFDELLDTGEFSLVREKRVGK